MTQNEMEGGDWECPVQLHRGGTSVWSNVVGAEADLCALAGAAV